MGWAAYKDRLLLEAAQAEFDVLVTVDHSLPHQNRIADYTLAIIVVHGQRSTLPFLLPLVPDVLAAIERAAAGTVIDVGGR